MLLEEPWSTLLALLAINYGGYCYLGIVRQSRGRSLVIGLGYRLVGEFGIITRTRCASIDVILHAVTLLRQFAPGNQHIVRTLHGNHASSQFLLQTLRIQLLHRHQSCHQQCSIKKSFFHCFLNLYVSCMTTITSFFSYPFLLKEHRNDSSFKKKSLRIPSQTPLTFLLTIFYLRKQNLLINLKTFFLTNLKSI